MIRILVALACLPLAGCVESAVPLESGVKVSDPGLIGIWKSNLHGDPMVATIRQETNGHLVADVNAYFEPGPKAAIKPYQIVLARFGEYRYMSIRDLAISPIYSLARYEFVGKDRFCVFGTFTDALGEDLEKKLLPGKVKPDRHVTSVDLSASSEELRAYFSKHGTRAFHEEDETALVFERVSSPELPPSREPPDNPEDLEITRCRR